nr:hypothetical protein [Desulfotruncus arcticus]
MITKITKDTLVEDIVLMGNRYDSYAIRFNDIQEIIRKTLENFVSNLITNERACLRIGHDLLNGFFNCIKERETKTKRSFLVI